MATTESTKLKKQAQEIIKKAEASGCASNYFFTTTFKRYQVQLDILDALEDTINDEGMLVTKEYVKNRKNLYTNPAIKEYNRTTDSANKTVSTLLRIIKDFEAEAEAEQEDVLLKIINGEDYDK